jgi:general secretion pathway protein A
MSVQAPAGNLYTSHFGLREAPFAITPDPGYLYMSARHQEALAHLMFGISEGGGFVQLTGEIGTGKTTLSRYLTRQLPAHVDVAIVFNPRVTASELLATVCDELRIPYDRQATTLKGFVDALYRYLLDAHARGRKTVLLIDEAQNLAPEVLEQVRLLTNLETEKDKLLQIILIGQPELGQVLAQPQLRQLAQRVTARYHLDPLSERESAAYIRHRLKVAGQKEMIFARGALREIYRLSAGVPRVINVICDRAMLGAWSKGQARISPTIVRQAAGEVLGRRIWNRQAVAAAAIVVAAAVLTAGAVAWRVGADRLAPLVGWGARQPPAAVPALPAATAPPAPAAPASIAAASAETAATPRAEPPAADLGSLLARGALQSGRDAAFRALYASWRLSVTEGPEAGCDQAWRHGLSCLHKTGTWSTLRRLDLPAVVELRGTEGARHYATVVGIDGDAATLAFGDQRRSVPFGQVDLLWDGRFVAFWRPPGVRTIPIALGMKGRDVEWLRQRLAVADGKSGGAEDREAFDQALQDRVIAFQTARSLIPDGIVGEETLRHLVAVTRPAWAPRLTAQ